MDALHQIPSYIFPLAIGLFLLANLLLGIYKGYKVRTFKTYALADKQMGTGTLIITLAATILGGEYVTAGVLDSYHYGLLSSSSWFFIMGGAMLFFSHFLFPKLLKLENCYTLGDIVGKLYGKSAQIFVGLLSVFVSVVLIAAQLLAISNLCELLHLNKTWIIVLIGVTVTIYTVLGGIRSVASTDILQFICLIIGFLFILYRIFHLQNEAGIPIGSIQNLFTKVYEKYADSHFLLFTHKYFWLIIFASFLLSFVVFSPPIINRVLVARDTQQMKKSFRGFVVLFGLIIFMLLVIGFGILLKSGTEEIPEDISFIKIAEYFFAKSQWAVVLLLLMVLAVVMSTADSFLNSLVVVVLRDLIQPFQKKEMEEKKVMKLLPFIAIIAGVTSVVFALSLQGVFVTSIVIISLFALGIFIVPLLFYAVGLQVDKKLFWVSVITYVLVSLLLTFLVHTNRLVFNHAVNWEKMLLRLKLYYVIVISLALTFAVTLLAHIITHKKLLFQAPKPLKGKIKKEEAPSLLSFFRDPIAWANERTIRFGQIPVLLGTFLSFSWMLPELTSPQPAEANLKIFFWVRLIGLLLCVGLMLHNRWGRGFKRFFPLYYYSALLYSLSFSYTLQFLYNPNNTTNLLFLFMAVVLLSLLVDRKLFFALGLIGAALAFIVAQCSPVVEYLSLQTIWYACAALLYATLVSTLFSNVKADVKNAHLERTKLWTSGFAHDLGHDFSGVLANAGILLRKINDTIKKEKKEGQVYTSLTLKKEDFDYQIIDTVEEIKRNTEVIIAKTDELMKSIKKGYVDPASFKKGSLLRFAEKAIKNIPVSYKPYIKINKNHDLTAKLHPAFLEYILSNLIKNASTHGHARKIEIGCDPTLKVLYIKDNGDGIPAEILPQVFNLYFTTGSSGIGLPFIKNLMECMGGSIRLTSSDEGTTFYLEFLEK